MTPGVHKQQMGTLASSAKRAQHMLQQEEEDDGEEDDEEEEEHEHAQGETHEHLDCVEQEAEQVAQREGGRGGRRIGVEQGTTSLRTILGTLPH